MGYDFFIYIIYIEIIVGMARNRSMQRTRNRRNKRGGELTPEEKEKLGWRCTFCSEDKKKFKVYMGNSGELYLKLLQNLSEDKANELFRNLNEGEKKKIC